MATAVQVPLSEYLHTSYEPDCEWIDGEVRERSVGEGSHAFIQTFFIKFFGSREALWQIRVTQELRTQVSESHFRVPDVLVLRGDSPFEEIVRTPPILCVEILSPNDRMIDVQDKIDDYMAMGVGAIWVVNPRSRKAFMVDRGALIPVRELTVEGTAISVSVDEMFSQLIALEAKLNQD